MKTTLLSSLLVFLLLVCNTLPAQNTCFSDWQYSSHITVNNANPLPLNDFQLRFTMDTQTLISQGKMNLDGSDIRVTGEDCCTPLPYWIQSGLNSASTVIWIRVPTVNPLAQAESYTFYYGNSAAAPMDNIDSVMFSIGVDSTGSDTAITGITAATQEYSFPIDVRTVRWRIYSAGAGDIRLKVSNDTNMVTGSSPLFSLPATPGYKFIDWEGITVPGGHVGYYTDDPIAMISSCAPVSPCPGGCGNLTYGAGNRGTFSPLTQDTCGMIPNFKVWYRRFAFIDPALSAPTGEFDRTVPFPTSASGAINFCSGNTVDLTVPSNSANGYQWYSGGVSIPGATDTIYTATTTGDYYCVSSFGSCETLTSDTVLVRVGNPQVNLGADRVVCTDLGALLDGGPGQSSYLWSTGDTTRTYLATVSGTYSVTVTDSNSCSTSDTVTLAIQPIPTPVINPSGPVTLCPGETVILDAFDPGYFAYDWNSGGPTSSNIMVDSAGSFYVTVYDSLNCVGTSDTVFVVNVPDPVVDLGTDTTLCEGDSLVLQAGGPWNSVLWPDSSTGPSFTVDIAGGYFVHVIDSFGCMGEDTIDILVDTLPLVDIGNDVTICPNTMTNLTATPGFVSYDWSSGDSTESVSVPGGTYQVVVRDANGCTNGSNIVIVSEYPETPVPTISGDQSGLSSTTTLNYQWYRNGIIIPNATSQNYQPTEPGDYYIVTQDSNGCAAFLSNVITVVFDITLDDIPEGFSPNGDNINDRWEIRNLDQFQQNSLKILNRWGSEVYQASPYMGDWNGVGQNGNELPDGTYFYILDLGRNEDPLSGYLIINR